MTTAAPIKKKTILKNRNCWQAGCTQSNTRVCVCVCVCVCWSHVRSLCLTGMLEASTILYNIFLANTDACKHCGLNLQRNVSVCMCRCLILRTFLFICIYWTSLVLVYTEYKQTLKQRQLKGVWHVRMVSMDQFKKFSRKKGQTEKIQD